MMCVPIINASGTQGGGIPGTAPTASFIWEPHPAMQGTILSLIDTSSGTRPLTFSWTVNGTFISSLENPNYYPSVPGPIVVGLSVVNAYGSDSTSNTIQIEPAA